MPPRGTRGAYRKEDRIRLPIELQKELVEKAAARYGNCQELAKALDIPKSSVHYYLIGRLTLPESLLKRMLEIAHDGDLAARVAEGGVALDRLWSIELAHGVFRDMCREKLRLPTRSELEQDRELRRKAATIVSYVLAEGSVWMSKESCGEHAVNITFAEHETDLYAHFRGLCLDVFDYDIGPPQFPGNGAKAIRGFIYSRFVAEWLIENGVPAGDKASKAIMFPSWISQSEDEETWKAAIQPFCDGEGSVGGNSRTPSFRFGQSRHTDLDFVSLPHDLHWRGTSRTIASGTLSRMRVFEIPVLDYCSCLFRSEILDDVNSLLLRVGFRTSAKMTSMYLKDDGFWSCQWDINFPSSQAHMLLGLGLIRQSRKRAKLGGDILI
jgi:hypothetical protein